jgi:hypothetical protein
MAEDRPDIPNPSYCRGRGCIMLLGAIALVVGIALAIPSILCGGQSGLLMVIVVLLLVVLLVVLTNG